MNLVMFLRAIKELRWPVLWYALGVILYGLMILSVYPAIRDNAQAFGQMSNTIPKSVMEAFGASDMTSFAGFIGGKYLNVVWPIVAGVFVIIAGAATVAREIERGTIELLLSVPESRTRLFVAKLVALFVGILLIVVATVGSLALGAAMVNETLDVSQMLSLSAALTAFAVAVGGYAVLFSSFSKERGKPAGMAAGLTLAFYLAWVISNLSDDWQWLGKVSIFTAFEPQRALANGRVDLLHFGVLFGIGIVCTVAALLVFRRRDAISS